MKQRSMRTYNSVWNMEKTLYAIQDIPLPMPVTFRQLGMFSAGVGGMWVLNQFPPFSFLHMELVEYVFLPGGFSWYMTKQKLDGKSPHRFLWTMIRFAMEPKTMVRYREVETKNKTYRYKGSVKL